MSFNERLKQARLAKGLTQTELGELIGIAKSTVAGYERGSSEPDLHKIHQIMEILSVDANYLWQDEMNEIEFPAKKSPEPTDIDSEDLHPLLKIYNELNTDGQERLMEYAEDLAEMPKYKKCPDISQKAIG